MGFAEKGLSNATARKDLLMVAGTSKRKYDSDCWSTTAYIPMVRHDPDALAGVSY